MRVKNQIRAQGTANWMLASPEVLSLGSSFKVTFVAAINKQRCSASIANQEQAGTRTDHTPARWVHLNAHSKSIYMQNYCCVAYGICVGVKAKKGEMVVVAEVCQREMWRAEKSDFPCK